MSVSEEEPGELGGAASNQALTKPAQRFWIELPDGMFIVPLSEAITSTRINVDKECFRMKWKDKEYICAETPYDTMWSNRASHQDAYVFSQSQMRDINPTPLVEAIRVGDEYENHPMFKSWCRALLSTVTNDEDLFRFTGCGKPWVLRPIPQSDVPLQKVHIGPGAIPDDLADKPCGTVEEALRDLNEIMGTTHSLEETPGLTSFLAFMIDESRDFGELYGRSRPWWYRDTFDDSRPYFEAVVQRMRTRKANDDRERNTIQNDSSIPLDSLPPPRRIWDLYSNRVLPYYVFRHTDTLRDDFATIDARLWMVSHSWVAEEDRVYLWTRINGLEWPVPFPRATTLEHVRVELLNQGAEYVWLDVLCLRQVGKEPDEPRRLDEWRVDVPTIGFIYQGEPEARFTVIYLNGLGLPCTTGDAVLQSERHWFNRVWTVQEAVKDQWLPGGLTTESVTRRGVTRKGVENVWAGVKSRATAGLSGRLFFPDDLAIRYCTNEADRVVVIGYCLHKLCRSLPVYDPKTSVARAWDTLLEHMLPSALTSILLQATPDVPFCPWWSMNALISHEPWYHYSFPNIPEMLTPINHLDLVPNSYTRLAAAERMRQEYGHLVTTVGPYYIATPGNMKSYDLSGPLKLHFSNPSESVSLDLDTYDLTGIILPNMEYTLANVMFSSGSAEYSTWVVFEAFETEQMLHGHPVIRAVKWGMIRFSRNYYHDPNSLVTGSARKAYVVYVDGDEAKRLSAHTESYTLAFEKMRASGRRVNFGFDLWDGDLILDLLEHDWGSGISKRALRVC